MRDAPTVLVMGCGDIGSAVARQLVLLGARVVLNDLPAPAHARRGMAYTDAMFRGSATLEGVEARFVDGLAGAKVLWRDSTAVPLTALTDATLLDAFGFDVVVDATLRRSRTDDSMPPTDALWIGIGPGFVPGGNCSVAVESQWGPNLGRLLRDASTAPLGGGPRELAGVGRDRFVAAPVSGRWSTALSLGDRVEVGGRVGSLAGIDGAVDVHAPIAGVLRGLTFPGVAVRAGQRIVEVDPREPPEVFGVGERPRAIASGVALALTEGSSALIRK
ncbi:MAG: hypothetical protein ABW136_03415 [Steroidobacteraceae bacterium]